MHNVFFVLISNTCVIFLPSVVASQRILVILICWLLILWVAVMVTDNRRGDAFPLPMEYSLAIHIVAVIKDSIHFPITILTLRSQLLKAQYD